MFFWLNDLLNFNFFLNFSNTCGAYKDQFSRISHYKNIRELILLFFMPALKKIKTTYVMRNLNLYVPDKGTYMTNQLY